MSKAPGEKLRGMVVSELALALRRIAIMYVQPGQYVVDREALLHIEQHAARFDLASGLANELLELLGFECGEPTDPRFDKTRRAAAKKAAKPPKGLTPKERAQWEADQAAEAHP